MNRSFEKISSMRQRMPIRAQIFNFHFSTCFFFLYALIAYWLSCGSSDSSGSQSSAEVSIFYRILHSRNMRCNFVQILLGVRELHGLTNILSFFCTAIFLNNKQNSKLNRYGGCTHHIKISQQLHLTRLYLKFLRFNVYSTQFHLFRL